LAQIQGRTDHGAVQIDVYRFAIAAKPGALSAGSGDDDARCQRDALAAPVASVLGIAAQFPPQNA
jgi:hypothetical protein